MSDRLAALATLLHEELEELARVVERTLEGWQRAQRSGDDFYIDGVALNLHGFYNGLERVFERIAVTIDGQLPQGANWHQVLLEQMHQERTGVRPAVISEETYLALGEYRGFRHVVRNVYTFRFDQARMRPLVDGLADVFHQAQAELLAFAQFLSDDSNAP